MVIIVLRQGGEADPAACVDENNFGDQAALVRSVVSEISFDLTFDYHLHIHNSLAVKPGM